MLLLAFFLTLVYVLWRLDTQRSATTTAPGLPPVSPAESRALDRAERQARWQDISRNYQQPWPWWFLGSCLAFAGLCLVAGIKAWPHVDSYALLVGGTLFLLFYAFKAFAQEQALAPQARLLARARRRWHSRTRA